MAPAFPDTPLAKQLDLRDGQRVWVHAMPESIADEIGEYALELTFVAAPAEGFDAAHIFVTERAELERLLGALRGHIAKGGQLWVSWPEGDPPMATDITADMIRELALPLGLVDTKMIAVDVAWAGLKLVVRKAPR